MTSEAPSGYVTKTAGEIRHAARSAVTWYSEAKPKWDATLVEHLVGWRASLKWWEVLLYGFPPKAPAALHRWYDDKYAWDRPDLPGLPGEPELSCISYEWLRRVKNMADETKVFIDVDDAAYLESCVARETKNA